MDLDTKDALKLFIEHSDRLSPEIIVDKLQSSRRNLYLYLDYLCTKDWETSKKFHAHMVALYADYNREKLLPFLKASDAYPIHVKLNFYHLIVVVRFTFHTRLFMVWVLDFYISAVF